MKKGAAVNHIFRSTIISAGHKLLNNLNFYPMNNNQTEKLKQMRLTAIADLHLQHVKTINLILHRMNTWHCWLIMNGKTGKIKRSAACFNRLTFVRNLIPVMI
jgi:hypothetical protein